MQKSKKSKTSHVPDDETTDLEPLVDRFIQNYRLFDDNFKHSTYNQKNKAMCLVTIGVTGSGKSTFIKNITNSQADVEIGIGKGSCTFLPRLYKFKSSFICDMPGFADTSKGNGVVVDMMSRCMLTRLIDPMFLIIIDIRFLFEPKCNTINKLYVPDMTKLFSRHFETCCNQSLFLLTWNDVAQKTEADCLESIRNFMVDNYGESDNNIRIFMRALKSNMFIIDYSSKDSSSLLEQILQRFDLMKRENLRKGVKFTVNEDVHMLSSEDNKIDEYCMSKVTFLKSKVSAFRKHLEALDQEYSEKLQSISKKKGETINRLRKSQDHLKELTKGNKILEAQIANAPKKRQSLIDSRKMFEEDLNRKKNLLEYSIEQSGPTDNVILRTDVSKKGWLSNYIEIDIPTSNLNTDYKILVVLSELGQPLNVNSSFNDLVKEYKRYRNDRVLYQDCGNKVINNCNFLVKIDDSMIHVSINYSKPFLMHLYSKGEVNNSSINNHSKLVLDIEQDQDKIDKMNSEIAQLEKDLEEEEQLKIESDKEMMSVRSKIEGFEITLKETTQDLLSFNREINQKLREENKKFQDNIGKDVTRVSEVSRIFESNNISHRWKQTLSTVEDGIQNSNRVIESYIAKYDNSISSVMGD